MGIKIFLSFLCMFFVEILHAQKLINMPENLSGHRSITFQHFAKHSFSGKLSINNFTLIDTEYDIDKNVIYFIRTMISWHFYKSFAVNLATGMKNPGKFTTLNIQYQYSRNNLLISYSAGGTFQNGFTFEQFLATNYTLPISKKMKAYVGLLAIANLNEDGYQRGLQQIKVGLKQGDFLYGFGCRLDQFNNASKTLENFGLFIQYKFKS